MSGNRDSFYVDFSNYKDRSSARLPEGEYLVRVSDAEATETKKGDPMVNVFLVVAGGPYADSPIIDRLTITEKALWRVANALRALGFKVEKRNMNIPIKAMIGRTMVIKVSDGDEYNGEIRSEIRSYAPAGAFKGYDFLTPEVSTSNESADLPVGEEADPTAQTGLVEAASAAQAEEFPVHQEGQPHQLGTAESQGPLGDEVRAQNADNEVGIPETGISL
jgi:hypothetical protein